MKLVLLAAGISKRMNPVKDKNLLKFLGKPLICHQTELARKAGFSDFVIVVSLQNRDEIERVTNDIEVKKEFVVQKEARGMADALMCAKDKILGEEILIVSTNDIVELSAYEKILEESKKGNFASFILGQVVKKYFPGGYLKVDNNDIISEIVEKPGEGNEPSNLVNLVMHLHRDSKKLFEYIEAVESDNDDIYEKAMDLMIKDGIKFKAVRYDGFWQAIKYPWHIFGAVKYFLDNADKYISKNVEISDKATIKGKVIIEDGVKIFENAIIKGPCYIGKNSVVANNALVRDYSYIGDSSVAGYSTEIARSYIGDNTWTHSNYIGDSIIGDNCSFGAGAVIGNLRLDGKNILVNVKDEKIDSKLNKFGIITGDNIRIGINASLMPGVKIGSGSFIGPGIMISQDIKEGSFVMAEQKLKVLRNKVKVSREKRKEMMIKLKNSKLSPFGGSPAGRQNPNSKH